MITTKFNLIHDNYYEFYVGDESYITFINKHNSLNGYYKLFKMVDIDPDFTIITNLSMCISIYFCSIEFYTL